MKTRMILLVASIMLTAAMLRADETVTVTATSSDISENLDLKTVATLFGQAEDLEQFEQMLNNPDSAFSNLDLNGDGEVDYLRVIETADDNRHLVVIQAVLAKDIFQDVASIFVEKDEKTNEVTVQVVGDEYIYGANYIIEPVYIYRPYIYDWFWGPSWVCWHSPYYWGYWPGWWRPFHCIDPFLYWEHCYWHHYYHPICSYRTGYYHHPHYAPMRETVRRNDFAQRHPDRSFASRNASRNIQNARALETQRRSATRTESARTGAQITRNSGNTRVSTRSSATRQSTYGSSNVRQQSNTRVASQSSRSTSRSVSTTTRGTSNRSENNRSAAVTTPSRTSRSSSAVRSSSSSTGRSSSSSVRSSSSSSMRSTSTPSMRSSSSGSMRSSGSMNSSGGASRSTGGSSRSGGGTRR